MAASSFQFQRKVKPCLGSKLRPAPRPLTVVVLVVRQGIDFGLPCGPATAVHATRRLACPPRQVAPHRPTEPATLRTDGGGWASFTPPPMVTSSSLLPKSLLSTPLNLSGRLRRDGGETEGLLPHTSMRLSVVTVHLSLSLSL